jgi:hypothetical protein
MFASDEEGHTAAMAGLVHLAIFHRETLDLQIERKRRHVVIVIFYLLQYDVCSVCYLNECICACNCNSFDK